MIYFDLSCDGPRSVVRLYLVQVLPSLGEPIVIGHGIDLQDCEKNWIPFVSKDEVYLTYSLWPQHTVLRLNMSTGDCSLVSETPSLVPQLRGGTNGLHLNDTIIFIGHMNRDKSASRPKGIYESVWYSIEKRPPFRMLRASPPFKFVSASIEFPTVLEMMPSQRYSVWLGVDDSRSYRVRFPELWSTSIAANVFCFPPNQMLAGLSNEQLSQMVSLNICSERLATPFDGRVSAGSMRLCIQDPFGYMPCNLNAVARDAQSRDNVGATCGERISHVQRTRGLPEADAADVVGKEFLICAPCASISSGPRSTLDGQPVRPPDCGRALRHVTNAATTCGDRVRYVSKLLLQARSVGQNSSQWDLYAARKAAARDAQIQVATEHVEACGDCGTSSSHVMLVTAHLTKTVLTYVDGIHMSFGRGHVGGMHRRWIRSSKQHVAAAAFDSIVIIIDEYEQKDLMDPHITYWLVSPSSQNVPLVRFEHLLHIATKLTHAEYMLYTDFADVHVLADPFPYMFRRDHYYGVHHVYVQDEVPGQLEMDWMQRLFTHCYPRVRALPAARSFLSAGVAGGHRLLMKLWLRLFVAVLKSANESAIREGESCDMAVVNQMARAQAGRKIPIVSGFPFSCKFKSYASSFKDEGCFIAHK